MYFLLLEKIAKSMYWYIPVCEIEVCKYITVYGSICMSGKGFIPVHTGTYCNIRVHNWITWFVPRCTRLASLKAATARNEQNARSS